MSISGKNSECLKCSATLIYWELKCANESLLRIRDALSATVCLLPHCLAYPGNVHLLLCPSLTMLTCNIISLSLTKLDGLLDKCFSVIGLVHCAHIQKREKVVLIALSSESRNTENQLLESNAK